MPTARILVYINGDLVRKLRKQAGWTQEKLAEELRVDVRTIGEYESGRVRVSNRVDQQRRLRRLAQIFKLPGPEALMIERTEQEDGAARGDLQPAGAPYDPAWYVPRERAEHEAAAYLAVAGKPVIVWGPRRFGKTWFLEHLRARWGSGRALQVRLHTLGASGLQDYRCFARDLARQFLEEREDSDMLHEQAFAREEGQNGQLTWLIKRLLTEESGPLLLVIDEADAITRSPFRDDFFGMLRGWAERRQGRWPDLRLMLGVSTTPLRLTESAHNSVFRGLSDPIALDSLTAAQILNLAERHQLDWREAEAEQLIQVVDGHPHLTRLVLYEAALHGTPLAQLLERPFEQGLFQTYMRQYGAHLRGQPELKAAVRALKRGDAVSLHEDIRAELHRLGLVTWGEDGVPRLRGHLNEALGD